MRKNREQRFPWGNYSLNGYTKYWEHQKEPDFPLQRVEYRKLQGYEQKEGEPCDHPVISPPDFARLFGKKQDWAYDLIEHNYIEQQWDNLIPLFFVQVIIERPNLLDAFGDQTFRTLHDIENKIPKRLLGYPLWGLQRRGDDTYLDPYDFSVLFGVREKHIRYLVQDELIDGETSDPSNLHAQDLLIPTTEILNFSYQPSYWRGCIGK